MYKNKNNPSTKPALNIDPQRSIQSDYNQFYDNNEFLKAEEGNNSSGLRLPNIKGDNKIGGDRKRGGDEQTKGNGYKQIETIDINVDYKDNKNKEGLKRNKEEVAKKGAGKGLTLDSQNYSDTNYNTENLREKGRNQYLKPAKMFHYSSLNESSIKPSSITQASKSINISKLNQSSSYVNPSKHRSLFKNNSKSRLSSNIQKSLLGRQREQTGGLSHKYSSQISKIILLSEEDLSEMSIEEIERQNNNIRGVMRKLNSELNEIIDRIALFKKSENKPNVEKSYKLLEQNYKNNQKILQTKEVELKKLKEKVNEIKGQDYESEILNELLEYKTLKKTLEKEIVEIKSNSTKITKNTDNKSKNKEIIKNDLIHLKKEVERHETKKKQTFFKFCQVEQKSDKLNKRYQELVNQMNEKGLEIRPTDMLLARKKELEEKEKALKKGIENVQNLYKTKGDILNNENTRIKRNITISEMEIKNIYNEIVEIASKSSLLIERERLRENPKLFKSVISSLEVFSRSASNPPMNYDMSRLGVESNMSFDHNFQQKEKSRIRTESECYNGKVGVKVGEGEGGGRDGKANNHRLKFKLNKNTTASERREREEGIAGKEGDKIRTFEVDKSMERQLVKNDREEIGRLKPTFNVKKKEQKSEVATTVVDKQNKQEVKEKQKEKVKQKYEEYSINVKPFKRTRKQSNVELQKSQVKYQDKQDNQSNIKQKQKQIQTDLKTKVNQKTAKQQISSRHPSNNKQLDDSYVCQNNDFISEHSNIQKLLDDELQSQTPIERNEFENFLLNEKPRQKQKIIESESTDLL